MTAFRATGSLLRYIGVAAPLSYLLGCGASRASIPDRQPEPVAPTMSPALGAPTSRTATPGHAPQVVLPPAEVRQAVSLRDRIRATADSAIDSPMWRNARWGMLIVDASSGDTLYAHDADRLFMPASNQKLLTAAVALHHLGAQYRWRTPVLLRGTQRGGTFVGDIAIAGSGDPSFSDSLQAGDALAAFAPVARALAARGIRSVSGRIMAEGDALPGLTTGFGWEIEDLDGTYGAPVDELILNEGELIVRARASGAVGSPVVIVTYPTRAYPAIVNRTTTRASGTTGEPLVAAYDSVGSALVLTGTLVVNDSARIAVSYRHPSDAVIAALRQSLVDAGIRVSHREQTRGSIKTLQATAAERGGVDTLAVLESPPLAVVLRRMQKPSQNQIAELLFRTSGRVVSGDGSADSARAVAARTLAMWGIAATDVAYRDGSGMSRHDYVTPRALVRVLDVMRTTTVFEEYRTALPLAGVDGTLRSRMRGTSAERNAYAKTGTVDKARALSGYVTSADGRLLMFALLANNFTVPSREVERVQDLLVSLLASEPLGATLLRDRD